MPVSEKYSKAFTEAAKSIAELPDNWLDHKIKDSFLNDQDWRALNTRFCQKLQDIGCTIVEGELDEHWEENKTFREMLEYVQQNCGA